MSFMRKALWIGMMLPALALLPSPVSSQRLSRPSFEWLRQLPEGETKRQFILDCTGCHQFDDVTVRPEGRARTRDEWIEAVRRMLELAGPETGFPVIGAGRDPERTAEWLVSSLAAAEVAPPPALPPVRRGLADVREFMMPVAEDLPHDVAVDSSGQVLITGMLSHRMYRLDPGSGVMREIPLPSPKGGPRAVEVDGDGNWWVLLGGTRAMGRYSPAGARWTTWAMGMYPHSVALDQQGRAWFNGHFSRNPEQIGSVTAASGRVETFDVPPHPTMAMVPGGPIPYELRTGPDGTIWGSELQGNRIFSYTPASRGFQTYTLPTPQSGPRRFDVDAQGTLWIPAYAIGKLVRFDPASRRFTEYELPIPDALPYVVRVDQTRGVIWIGTGAADALFRFEPASARFTVFPLPTRGAMVRHMAIDPRSLDIWLAYGASPGRIPARIARVRVH